jgi:hypothetical protein
MAHGDPPSEGWRHCAPGHSLRYVRHVAQAHRLLGTLRQRHIMSIALYRLRLYWDGRRGAARNGDDTLILFETPRLPGAQRADELAEIDYAPEVDVAQVREREGDWREMTPDEVAAAEALLASLSRSGWPREHAALPSERAG